MVTVIHRLLPSLMWVSACFVFISFATASEGSSSCDGITDDKWDIIEHQGQCYEFVPVPELWTTARDRCWKYGGRLVTVDAQSTADFLEERFRALTWNSAVWIGLNDKDDEGSWRWISHRDADPVAATWTNWKNKKWFARFSGRVKDCVKMDPQESWKWIEEICNIALNKYVCQYDPRPSARMTTVQTLAVTTELGREEVTTASITEPWPAHTEKKLNDAGFNVIAAQSKQEEEFFTAGTVRALAISLGAFGLLIVILLSALLKRRRTTKPPPSYSDTVKGEVWAGDEGKRDLYTSPNQVMVQPCRSKANQNTYVPRGIAQKIVAVDDVYLHMGGQKTESVYCNDGEQVVEVIDRNVEEYEEPYPSLSVYSEIGEPTLEYDPTYQSIDEVLEEIRDNLDLE